jgi:hypothetical protein
LSQSFQHDELDYTTIQTRLFQVRSQIIEDFLHFKDGEKQLSEGSSTAEWDAAWDGQLSASASMFDDPSSILLSELLQEGSLFRGVELANCSGEARSKAMLWVHKFALAIMSRLRDRFPAGDMEILEAMEILNPRKLPSDSADLKGYGKQELETIIGHYGSPKSTTSGNFVAPVDPELLRVQWRLFKHTLHTYKEAGITMRDAWASLLPPTSQHGELPSEIEKLICVKLIFCLNTAC